MVKNLERYFGEKTTRMIFFRDEKGAEHVGQIGLVEENLTRTQEKGYYFYTLNGEAIEISRKGYRIAQCGPSKVVFEQKPRRYGRQLKPETYGRI